MEARVVHCCCSEVLEPARPTLAPALSCHAHPHFVPCPPSPELPSLLSLPFLVRLEKPHTSHPERPGSGRVPLSWERGLQLKPSALGWFLYSVDAGRFRTLSAAAWVSWLVSSFLCQRPPPSWGRIKKTRGQKSGLFVKETIAVGRRDKA